jgi:hypothetical protein
VVVGKDCEGLYKKNTESASRVADGLVLAAVAQLVSSPKYENVFVPPLTGCQKGFAISSHSILSILLLARQSYCGGWDPRVFLVYFCNTGRTTERVGG